MLGRASNKPSVGIIHSEKSLTQIFVNERYVVPMLVLPLFSLGIIGARSMVDYACSQQANMLVFSSPATVVCQLFLRVAYIIELTHSGPPIELDNTLANYASFMMLFCMGTVAAS